jgi:hypothetical protein
MNYTENDAIGIAGNGQKVCLEKSEIKTLWQPKDKDQLKPEPLWHLRISVLKDQEGRGDCPSRSFVSVCRFPFQAELRLTIDNRHSNQFII